MDSFEFINATDGSSGKVTAPHARQIIRAHVMRDYWTNVSQSRLLLSQTRKSRNSSEKANVSSGKRAASNQDTVDSDEAVEYSNTSSSRNLFLKQSKTRQLTALQHKVGRQQPDRVPCQFFRVTEPFVYARSAIDITSYQFFNHYSIECLCHSSPAQPECILSYTPTVHVILCDQIQPISPPERPLCCSTAILENSSALLHAICFTSAAHATIVRGEISKPRNLFKAHDLPLGLQREAFRHKATAVNLLNNQLSQQSNTNGVSESMILCVTLLLAAEAILGDDRTALIAHMKGLGRMIELNGGEDFLSPAVATQVRLADLKAALVRQSRPSFKLPPFLRRRVAMAISTPSSIQDPALSTLGSGFQSPPLSLHIASDLHQCIRYMHHLSSITEQSHTDKRPCCEYGIDDFSALDHSLISLSFKCRLSNLEECIRITLLLYSNTALWKTPLYFNWIIALVAELKTALIATDWQLVAAEHTELFLWVVLMGRYAASADVEEVIAWWDLKLRFVVSVLGLHEWEHAKLIVKAFFYLEQTYGRAWEGIWNSIVLGLGDELQQPEQHPAKHPCSC